MAAISISLPDSLLAEIDRRRGGLVPRSAWIASELWRSVSVGGLEPTLDATAPEGPKGKVTRPQVPVPEDNALRGIAQAVVKEGLKQQAPKLKKPGKEIFKCPKRDCTRSHLGPAKCSNHGVDMVSTGQVL